MAQVQKGLRLILAVPGKTRLISTMLKPSIGTTLIIGVLESIGKFLGGPSALNRKMRKGVLVAESPREEKSRRWWEWVHGTWVPIALVLFAIATLVRVIMEMWG